MTAHDLWLLLGGAYLAGIGYLAAVLAPGMAANGIAVVVLAFVGLLVTGVVGGLGVVVVATALLWSMARSARRRGGGPAARPAPDTDGAGPAA